MKSPAIEGRKEKLGTKLICNMCKKPVWLTCNGICTNCRRQKPSGVA